MPSRLPTRTQKRHIAPPKQVVEMSAKPVATKPKSCLKTGQTVKTPRTVTFCDHALIYPTGGSEIDRTPVMMRCCGGDGQHERSCRELGSVEGQVPPKRYGSFAKEGEHSPWQRWGDWKWDWAWMASEFSSWEQEGKEVPWWSASHDTF